MEQQRSRAACVRVAVALLVLACACSDGHGKADGETAGAAYERASQLVRAGQLKPAALELETALRHDPAHVKAQLLRGAVLERLNRLPEAEQAFLEAQRLAPEHTDPPLHLARVARMRVLDARIAAALEALATAPARGTAHRELGDLMLARRLADPAQLHYVLALRHDPDDFRAHSGLAVVLVGLRRQVRGLYHASEALRLTPGDPRALGELVWVLATSSDDTLRAPRQAIRRAEAAVEKTPRLLDGLAAAYAAVGRQADALATAQSAIEAARSAQDHGMAHAILGRLAVYQRGESFVGPPIDPG